MSSHFYALLSRMRNIRRWGLMANSFEENIQEHCMMTAVLAHGLALLRRDKFGGSADPEKVALRALYHDVSEIFTGDMPTPVKYDNPAISRAYKEVEAVALERLLEKLPEELRPSFEPVLLPDRWDQDTRELVKAADKLAAYLKCVEELRAGNGEFRKAAEQTRAALERMDLPEVAYFLEEFAPSFALTLDEQD